MCEQIPDNIQAIFFDHDDTLVNTIGTKWAQHKYIARRFYDRELSDDDIREHWGKPLDVMIGLLYGTDDLQDAMQNVLATRDRFEKELFEFTMPTLRMLKLGGYALGVITATSSDSFNHDLEYHNVGIELFDYVQTSEDTKFHKPDPRVFVPAVSWLSDNSIKPENVLYVGDGLHDMKAAKDAGFVFFGVETGLVSAEEFAANGAKSVKNVGKLVNS